MNKQNIYIQTSTVRSIFILCFLVFSVLAAYSQPVFTKKFSGNTIPGGVVTLTFTIDNSASGTAVTNIDFTDNLPAGVTVATPANGGSTCTGGTITAVAGTGVISYSGGSVAANAVCEISVDVTSSVVGTHLNTTGDMTSSAGNSGTASTILSVSPPELDITLSDSISYDPSMDMIANPGDSIKYTLEIENTGDTSVFGLGIDRGSDPNTTFDPSTIRATPVAINDNYQLMVSPMNIPMGMGLLANDADINDPLPNPPFNDNLTVLSVQGGAPGSSQTTANGGTVTVNTNGSFVYDSTGVATAIADSFFYKIIDSESLQDSAQVIISWTRPPGAQNDNLATTINTVNNFVGGTLFNDNGNGADDRGIPESDIVSFGGGDAGGTVTSNAAGNTVAFAGGMLTVNANGSLMLSNPTSSGLFTFSYRIQNAYGFSDAIVTVSINEPPVAQDDSYTFLFSVDQNVSAGDGLFVDNGSGADELGYPAAALTSFGGGSLGGSVTDHAATASVAIAGGTLTVNADGSWSLTGQPFTPGTYTFDYRIGNVAGVNDATVTLVIQDPPLAQPDALSAEVNIVNNFGAAYLFADNGSGSDHLGTPAATIVSFGDGNAPGTVTTTAAGNSVTFAGGMLTVNADGSLVLSNPTMNGVYTFEYRIQNTAGFSDATVTLTINEPPVAQADSYTFLFSSNQNIGSGAGLFVDNGSGADDLGYPAAELTFFGGGSLGGTITDHAAGSSVTLADGTLTVNADGSWSLTGQPFTPGTYTFDYRIGNVAGANDATVTLVIQDPPVAQADAITATTNMVNNYAALTLFADNGSGTDHLGTPSATVVSFGGGDAGGTVTSNAAGNTAAFAGGMLTVNADGSLSVSNPTVNGVYTFDYRIQNASGFSDATVTLTINEPPVAQPDAYTFLFSSNQNIGSGAGLFVDNGSGADDLGYPSAELTFFGGGSLGGTVTDHAAGSSVTLAGGTLTVNADGSWSLTGQPFTPGTYTFDYRIGNVAGVNDATATLVIQDPPEAQADAITATTNMVNNYAALTLFAENGSGTDHLGTPAATVVSFGGGDAGGTVTSNAAGNTAAFAGGVLTVNADGSLSVSNPSVNGVYTFDYRIQNASGFSDATVTLTINEPPTAQPDLYTFLFSSNQNISSGAGLFADNGSGADDFGYPVASLTFFGGGSLGGTVTDHSAGSSVALAGGTLTVNADGSWSLTGQPFTKNTYTFDYRIESSSGTSDATVTLVIQDDPPVAQPDTYAATGNIPINTTTVSGNSLLANDMGSGISVSTVQGLATNVGVASATTNGGSVIVQTTGEFIYTPPTGFTGDDDFTYSIGNGSGNSAPVSVTITVSDLIYFMDDAATTGGSGSMAKPYMTIAEHNSNPPPANSTLFIKDNGNAYSGNLVLLTGQTVIGEGSAGALFGSGSLTGIILAPLSNTIPYNTTGMNTDWAQIVNPSGNAVTLNTGNTITGLSIGNRMTYAFVDPGSSVGTLSLKQSEVTGTGGGVKIGNGGILDIDLASISTSGGANGLWLKNTSGMMVVSGGTITNPTASAIDLEGGSVNITFTSSSISQSLNTNTVIVHGGHSGMLTYSGTVNTTNGNGLQFNNADGQYNFNNAVNLNGGDAGIDIVNGSGGSFTFSNTVITNPSGTALNINGSTANVAYTGGTITQNTTASGVVISANTSIVNIGAQLNLNTGTNPGINVLGGGTIEITNSNNSVSTTTVTAVSINGSTIGASGVTLASVSCNGASRAIYLNNAGPASGGFFTVTGTGTTDGTGGTIQNITNRGVEIVNTDKVTLKNMNFTNVGTTNAAGNCNTTENIGCNAGIYGTQSNDIVLDNLFLNGGVQIGINGKDINNWSMANSTVQGFGNQVNEHGIYMRELTGNMSINNSTIKTSAERNVLIKNSSGTLNFVSNGSTYSESSPALGADGLEFSIYGSATGTIDIDDCSFLKNRTNGLQVLVEGNASVTQCDVTNSTFDPQGESGIAIDLTSINTAQLRFNIIDNPMIYANKGSAVNIFADDNALVEGRVNDNPDIKLGGAGTYGTGIRVNINNEARGIVQINNNTVGNIGWDMGIDALARGRSTGSACGTGCVNGRLDVQIMNNTVALADQNSAYDIRTQAQDENTVCAYVADNTTSNLGIAAFRSRTNDANATLLHQGFNTSATITWASNGNTPTTPGAVSDSHFVGVVTEGTCTLPSNALP